MNRLKYLLILLFLVMAIIAIAARNSLPFGFGNNTNRLCDSSPPSLAEILKKTGEYSFSSVNVAGRRIIAVDEIGHRYFYVYDVQDRVASIVDQNGLVLWRATDESCKATR